MCRMYAHRTREPLPVAGMLLDARHSLRSQSCRDWRCESHRDGWGIGYFTAGQPRVIRRAAAAPDDPEFAAAAREIISATVIGHVRQASVGNLVAANAHPFAFGHWMFAHNGTVTGFEKIAPALTNEIDADLRQQIAGTTDSEHVFFWLLSHLRQAGQPAEGPCSDLPIVTRIVAEGMRTLTERSAATGANEPARLNFFLTDGAVFIASRWKHTLFWTNRAGPFASPSATKDSVGRSPGVAIASEAIGEAPWAEVPEGHVLSVDADFVVRWRPI